LNEQKPKVEYFRHDCDWLNADNDKSIIIVEELLTGQL